MRFYALFALQIRHSRTIGALCRTRLPQYKPDVLTLGIEMPEMDGLETLRRLRRNDPQLRVMMLSTLRDHSRHRSLTNIAGLRLVSLSHKLLRATICGGGNGGRAFPGAAAGSHWLIARRKQQPAVSIQPVAVKFLASMLKRIE